MTVNISSLSHSAQKFAKKVLLQIPPYPTRLTTLPCEILVFK